MPAARPSARPVSRACSWMRSARSHAPVSRSAEFPANPLASSSCWNAYASEDIVGLAAGQHERAGLLELAHDGDDPALRLFDDALALRRLVLHLLGQHLGAALGHVGEDRVLDLLADATQRQGQILLIGLAQDELDAAVVELADVLEHEQQAAYLVGKLLVGRGQRVEHSALGRAVRAVEDVG